MSTIAVTTTDPETAGGVTVHRKTYCRTSELEGGKGRRRRGMRSKKEEEGGEEGEEEEEGGRRGRRREKGEKREKRRKEGEEEEGGRRGGGEIKIILQCPPSLSWRPLSHPLTTAHKSTSK